jgi:Tfp pilus assembly protein PilF
MDGDVASTLAELQRAVRQDPSRERAWADLAQYAASELIDC